MSEDPADEVFAVAGGAIDVPPLRTAGITERVDAVRARRRRRVGAVLGGGALAVAAATLVGAVIGSESPVPAPAMAPVLALDNPAPASWWANDILYLEHSAVQLPRVDDLVDLGDGAVIGDDRGGVLLVSPDGRLTEIGQKVPGAPLVASPERGLVAWVDPGDRSPRLVVYDSVRREVRATLDLPYDGTPHDGLPEGSHPIALDRETLYYADEQGDWRLRPPWQTPEKVDSGGLVDVASAVVLRQEGPTMLDVVQPFFSVDHRLPGSTGARLSPGGEYVLTRLPAAAGGGVERIRVYDARSGEPTWTGVHRGDQVLASSLGPEDVVSYVVARRADQPGAGDYVRMSFTGPYELRTCHLAAHTCSLVARFPHTGALPVLAQ